jgi:hypothetical protein
MSSVVDTEFVEVADADEALPMFQSDRPMMDKPLTVKAITPKGTRTLCEKD